METINSIGFVNFWGVTPSYNILDKIGTHEEKSEINILINNSNDIRHVLKTIHNTFETNSDKEYSINFYISESHNENLARDILFLHILHDVKLSIRDRVEIFMDIYGNTLVSSRTADYISTRQKELIRFVTGDTKYSGILGEVINLSLLNYKDRDDLVDIFSSWDSKVNFDVEKYRDDRLRYMYKDRYDHRSNLADWDYCMKTRDFAPIIKNRHYLEFRETGVAFMMRINKYITPNRTLSSYIPGREVK
jgi:dynein assembly factor 3